MTFDSYLIQLETKYPKQNINYYQSNHEGSLIDKLQEIGFRAKGIIFNPAAYTHTSLAIADTIIAITSPVIEVHISDIYQRENFRQVSYLKDHCLDSIVGKGLAGYEEALQRLMIEK